MTRHLTRANLSDTLARIAVPEQPALAPDGRRVAYVRRTNDLEQDRNLRSLWCVTASGEDRPLTRGPADSSPAWAPDGGRLAFLREGQIWVLAQTGGEAERLTDLAHGAGAPQWSPDGDRIAFCAPVGEVDQDAPVVTDRLDYQADGSGLRRGLRSQVHVLDVTGGEVRLLTHGDLDAGHPAWSPDGARLAFPADCGVERDLDPQPAAYVVDAGGGEPERVTAPGAYVATTGWTPDGEALLVVAAVGVPTGPTTLLRVPVGGGEVEDLAADLDRTVMPGGPGYPGAPPQASVDDTVFFCVRESGCTELRSTRGPVLTGAGRVVSGISVVGATVAAVVSSPTSYGEVVLVDPATGQETALTDHTVPDLALYVREPRTFTISDGTQVQAWLLRDSAYEGPRPTLLDVHGGPHNSWNGAADEMHLYHQLLASQGWLVLTPNPRGSDGYGQDFWTAVQGAWGPADRADFLEPLDELVAEGLADPERLAVTGYSYGGFATCWLTAHDDRFAAAVAGGVVSDLVSISGTSEDAHPISVHELGGVWWESRESYAAMSPLEHVDRVRTPTLVYHATEDRTCPVGQAQQWFTALRERRVPTRLVLYPGGSHLFVLDGRPSHRLDLQHRVVDWVVEHAAGRRPLDAVHWQQRLGVLATRHEVPGAQLAVLRLGDGPGSPPGSAEELVEATHGVLSTATGVEVTRDSLFQIGSITKVWTATLAMRLVDEGLLSLDTPVAEVLPDFTLADPDTAKTVTLRHLLTHTSGIDGDVFTDTGRGDDCLAKYVAGLDQAAQNHPLGATWSYCNAGFPVIGRMAEVLSGQTWDAALRAKVIDPLGLDAVTLPEEAVLRRAAVGHVRTAPGRPLAPTHVWLLPRSLGPAGLVDSSARDVVRFARMHLRGGMSEDGTRMLEESTATAMAARHAELPDPYVLGDSWGLGWIRFDWDGHRLIGHDGSTLGQAAFLRILPEQGLAVALLTNGGNAQDLYQDLYREIFAEVAGVVMPRPLGPATDPPAVDPAAYLGTYERASVRVEVLDRDGDLVLRTTATGPLAELMDEDPVDEMDMHPVQPDVFVVRPVGTDTWIPVTFYDIDTGQRFVHFGARATPKVG